jgi:biopolymer transport protein ExbD
MSRHARALASRFELLEEHAVRIASRADINVTPMIDVMLVLLIIFMIVAPVIQAAVALPAAANPNPRPSDPADITLIIDRSGAYGLQSTAGVERIPSERLAAALGALYQERVNQILYLKADSTLEFGIVQQTLEIARRAGVRVVGAVVEQQRGGLSGH